MTMKRRRVRAMIAAAFAVLAATVAASGCGSSSVSNTIDPVAQAASASNRASGFQLSMLMRLTSPQLPSAITGQGNGAFSPSAHLGQLSFTMTLPQSAGLGGSGFGFQEIIDGRTIYMKLPAAITAKLPQRKPWLKVDLAQVGKAAGLSGFGSLLGNPTTGNPAELLQYLRATSGGVTKVGTAQIKGIPTTQYRASVQLDKYPNLLPPARRAAARQAIGQLETMTKLHAIPMSVWIDNQHLVRQLVMAFNEQLPTGGTIAVQMTMQFSHYGRQPAPTLPPADQVGDLGGLLSAAQHSTSTGSATTAP